MISGPLVSICIPTYNGSQLLREAIASALNQTYPFIEIVISDDNSTDNTSNTVEAFQDKRIRYTRNEKNIGLAENFRKSLMLSGGKYICFLGQDDILEPTFIEWAVSRLEEQPRAAFAFCGVGYFGTRTGRRTLQLPLLLDGPDFIDISLSTASNLVYLCGSLARRDLIKVEDMEDYIFFDWTLWLRLASRGQVIYTPRVLAKHRYHSAKATIVMMRSYSRHCKELGRAVRTFVHTDGQSNIKWNKLLRKCRTKLFETYTSLLASDRELRFPEFLCEIREFAHLPAPAPFKIYRLTRTLAKRIVLDIQFRLPTAPDNK